MKIFNQTQAYKALGISRAGYNKWVKQGKIRRTLKDTGISGDKPKWVVDEDEIKRVKAIIAGGWVRGKSKLAKRPKRSRRTK